MTIIDKLFANIVPVAALAVIALAFLGALIAFVGSVLNRPMDPAAFDLLKQLIGFTLGVAFGAGGGAARLLAARAQDK